MLHLAVEQDLVVVVGTTGECGVENQELQILMVVELVMVVTTITGMVTVVMTMTMQFTSNSGII